IWQDAQGGHAMSFRFRVVPKKKRRGSDLNRSNKISANVQIEENLLQTPLMKEHSFFDLPQDVRDQLGVISSTLAYPKGEVLFVEGQKSEGVFLLHRGSVKLSAG